jgi:hypothetical protein
MKPTGDLVKLIHAKKKEKGKCSKNVCGGSK